MSAMSWLISGSVIGVFIGFLTCALFASGRIARLGERLGAADEVIVLAIKAIADLGLWDDAEFVELSKALERYEEGIKFIHGNESYYRTVEQQKALYDAGKSKCDGTNIRSKHQSHLARDLFVVNDKSEIVWEDAPYAILGAYNEVMKQDMKFIKEEK